MSVRAGEPSLRAVAELRQGAYRLLAALLLGPDAATVAVAADAARHLQRRSAWAAGLGFFLPWDHLLRRLATVTPADQAALQAAYSDLFLLGGRRAIPLCESGYVDPAVVSPGLVMADVERTYAAAGLCLAPRGEAPDHAGVQLEFLSFLCGQETEAWGNNLLPAVLQALIRQRRFLQRHPCPWLPRLAQAVARRDGQGLYTAVTQVAWALVAHDADFTGALAHQLAAPREVNHA